MSSTVAERLIRWLEAGQPHVAPARRVGQVRDTADPLICPSQSEAEGTICLGLSRDDGSLVRVADPRRVEELPVVDVGRARLAGDCRESDCAYWAGSCQLAGVVIDASDGDGVLVRCDLRRRCRWFLEQGFMACGTCSQVSFLMTASSESPTVRSPGAPSTDWDS